MMLNLDSEEDGALYVGCAGGMDTAGVITMNMSAAPASHEALEIMVSGLQGGHSGLDINTGRGNAIKFLTRVLTALRKDFPTIAFSHMIGGSKRNAIPREAEVTLYVPKADTDAIIARMAGFTEIRYLRLLMQLRADAVTYERTHNRKTVRLHIRLNGVGDIGHSVATGREAQTFKKALLRDIN